MRNSISWAHRSIINRTLTWNVGHYAEHYIQKCDASQEHCSNMRQTVAVVINGVHLEDGQGAGSDDAENDEDPPQVRVPCTRNAHRKRDFRHAPVGKWLPLIEPHLQSRRLPLS